MRVGFCSFFWTAGFAQFFEEGGEKLAFAVGEGGEQGGEDLVAFVGELAEGLFAVFGDLDPDSATIFLVATGDDEFAGAQALNGGGHGAAGESDLGGDLIDGCGPFFRRRARMARSEAQSLWEERRARSRDTRWDSVSAIRARIRSASDSFFFMGRVCEKKNSAKSPCLRSFGGGWEGLW